MLLVVLRQRKCSGYDIVNENRSRSGILYKKSEGERRNKYRTDSRCSGKGENDTKILFVKRPFKRSLVPTAILFACVKASRSSYINLLAFLRGVFRCNSCRFRSSPSSLLRNCPNSTCLHFQEECFVATLAVSDLMRQHCGAVVINFVSVTACGTCCM